jgi:hypothetical protein
MASGINWHGATFPTRSTGQFYRVPPITYADAITDSGLLSDSDFDQDGVRDQTHPKLYFGKWKHALYETPRTDEQKNNYVPTGDDFRNDDYYFLAYNNLRNAADPSVLNGKFYPSYPDFSWD